MARYKAIKPVWENPKEKQAKKEARRKEIIFRTFSYIFVALLILGIIITGTNYDNDIIFGVGYITMSIITVWAIIFVTYTELKGWYKSIAYWKKTKKDLQKSKSIFLERVMGIEPTQPAWKAGILPLNNTRIQRLIILSQYFCFVNRLF